MKPHPRILTTFFLALVFSCSLPTYRVQKIQGVDESKEAQIKETFQAAQKCRNFAFENDFHDSLIPIIHIENIHSEKVALKLGMKKTIRSNYKNMPVHIVRIDKADWLIARERLS